MKNFTLMVLFFIAVFCNNPFSPPKGPPSVGLLNHTPGEIFKNLETAYNTQNLSAFMELLSDDFIFVVSPDFVPEKSGTKANIKSEDIDNDGQLETYWGRDWEEENHKRIFSAAKSINLFLPCPACGDSSRWIPWVDYKTGDTIGIYIVIETAQLTLITKSDRVWRLMPRDQKFGLKKDPKDTTQWVIGEWHEGAR